MSYARSELSGSERAAALAMIELCPFDAWPGDNVSLSCWSDVIWEMTSLGTWDVYRFTAR